ncbi:hypothetical protein N8I77_002160 [Diaporthe amygdali]|uniref:Uncharacterized protein n=1 Tax=Phomopsis amygdali TaxID=1214568 RepID=A0AAD9SSD2_PHOAM|nr:hypothetical protein N8I77_002160 [Diaporthe amygdali]KAK2615402.1 hypothetical protein N8I77_002160 [Diaporthe amygdali]
MRSILLQWYIRLDKQKNQTRTWACPIPDCQEEQNTFLDVIEHLQMCQYVKSDTRQYMCPDCHQTDIQIPSIGYAKKAKTLVKIRKSLDNILGHSNSPDRPSTSRSSLASEREQPSPIPLETGPFEMGNQDFTVFNSKENNRHIPIIPINTQVSPVSTFRPCSNDPCLSAISPVSSFWSGFRNTLPSYGSSLGSSLSTQYTGSTSAISCTPTSSFDSSNMSPCGSTMQPHYNFDPLAALSCGPSYPELPRDDLMQTATSMEGMEPSFIGQGIIGDGYGVIGEGVEGEIAKNFQASYSQRGEFSQFMPEPSLTTPIDALYNGCIVLEAPGSAGPASAPSSPIPSDTTMEDSSQTSESPVSPTSDSLRQLKCNMCNWRPEMSAKRSVQRMKQAVQKHIKRNHESQDYHCPICSQPFRNRPDNVKPHVARKHPEKLASLYPKTVQDGYQFEKKLAAGRSKAVTSRRASVPVYISDASDASPTRRRLQRK